MPRCLSFAAIVVLLPLILAAPVVFSENDSSASAYRQSHLSCSIITSEHLTTLQLYQRGLPLDVAIESLPKISRAAKKRVKYIYDMVKEIGILNAYADINTNYARCSTLVYKQNGKPAVDLQEYGYYYCAGENKLRYELILQIDQNISLEKLIQSASIKRLNVVKHYHQLIESKGVLAAFDLTANNLKNCLNRLD